ncbi:DNA-binding transcriptional LysR family regulator [Rhodoligotrophos appendicifer]|uniref:LysR substrate-binding domain-containing protein n=1 Tax=Rhodoligotrophos appendicifer TaxID=987056 RepID=UPI001185E8A8|nr:LysR substrate-binding domain-containing protein [Rhodoligotrophos appendicifer]
MKNSRKLTPILHALVAHEAAVRLESFSLAASELGVSQPAISSHIRKLEDHLGVLLFERRNRVVKPTLAGREFAEATRQGFAGILEAIDRISEPARTLTIGASYSLSHLFVLPALSRLQALFPNRTVRLLSSNNYADFDTDEVAFSIRFGPASWREHSSHLIIEERIFPVAAPSLLANLGKTDQDWSLDDLAKGPLLHLDSQSFETASWYRFFAAHGRRMRLLPSVGSFTGYDLLLQSVTAGKGIGLGWEGIVDHALKTGALKRLFAEPVVTSSGFHVVFKEIPDGVTPQHIAAALLEN